jgi:hypothetical protein
MRMYFSKGKRHVHVEDGKAEQVIRESNDTWIEECTCGMRRIGRIGWGRESGCYYSRWYEYSEIEKLSRIFKDKFTIVYNKVKQ